MSTKNTANSQNFSGCLKAVLDERGLTQRFLIDKGIGDSAQVSRWVTGKVTPYPKTQQQIGAVLGVEFTQLADGSYVAVPMYQPAQNMTDILQDPASQYAEPSLDDLSKMLEQIESFARIARDAMQRMKQKQKKIE